MPLLVSTMLGKDSNKSKIFNQLLSNIDISLSTENLLIFLALCIFFKSVIFAGAKTYAGFTVAKIVKDLRKKLLKGMSNAEWQFFVWENSQKNTASLMAEAAKAGKGYLASVEIFSSCIQIFAYLFVAFVLSWKIATLAIITSAALLLLFKNLVYISKNLGSQDTSISRDFAALLGDLIRSIKSLKAMARDSHSNIVLETYTKQLKSVDKKSIAINEIIDMVQEIFLMTVIVVTIYYAIKHLSIPVEYMIVLAILYIRIMKLFGKTQKQIISLASNISGFDGIIETIERAENYREIRPGKIKHDFMGCITINNVSFSFKKNVILKNATTKIQKHTINTIIGPSGTGKTTLVDLICGLYVPTDGEILIDGIPLTSIDINYWRSQIGYVIQDHSLLDTTIRDNVALRDPSITNQEIITALDKAHALDFVNSLENTIYEKVGEVGSKLSGGQKQRILIARAIVHSPKLLILDEATSALDSETEKSISSVFVELSKTLTIISISHRPAMIDASNNIIELRDKKLFQSVNP